MKLNADTIMAFNPCPEWTRERVEELLATYGGEVEHDVLLRDQRVLAMDREWLGRKLLEGDDASLRRYICARVERSFEQARGDGQKPDKWGLKAVNVAQRYARGEATAAEMDVALTVWSFDQTIAAAVGGRAAERDAVDPEAEWGWQVERLIELLAGK